MSGDRICNISQTQCVNILNTLSKSMKISENWSRVSVSVSNGMSLGVSFSEGMSMGLIMSSSA